MTKEILNFDFLDEYKAQGTARAEATLRYQKATQVARSKVSELTTQYEQTFTKSIQDGKDATKELDAIQTEIDLARTAVERAEREERLARSSMPSELITSVDVVEKYSKEYVPAVRERHIQSLEDRVKIGRDLIISALVDGKALQTDYDSVSEELKDMMHANHSSGKANMLGQVQHPIRSARILKATGITSAVRLAMDEIAKTTYGTYPYDYEYLPEVSQIDGTTKGAK